MKMFGLYFLSMVTLFTSLAQADERPSLNVEFPIYCVSEAARSSLLVRGKEFTFVGSRRHTGDCEWDGPVKVCSFPNGDHLTLSNEFVVETHLRTDIDRGKYVVFVLRDSAAGSWDCTYSPN